MTSEIFKTVIQEYLTTLADTDEAFKIHYTKEGKTIDNCCDYILTEVKKADREGFADEEIYNMARKYYELDEVVIEENISANIIVNRPIQQRPPVRRPQPQPQPNEQLNLF